MSNKNWTPGHWVVDPYKLGTLGDVCDNDGNSVALCQQRLYDEFHKERKANAHLISAAPELYKALERAIENAEQAAFEEWLEIAMPSGCADSVSSQWIFSIQHSEFCDDYADAIAALAKARGEA